MVSPGIGVWDLWSELSKESEALGDPVFLDCVEAASANRIFDNLSDEKLKASLSLINSLLNDPKTRAKGLTLFSDLAIQIKPSRLIAYQDAVISGLHLVVKSLDSPLGCTVLANLLPKCHSISDVNQVVTSTIIPKILTYFCEEGHGKDSKSGRSLEELTLLKICLQEYHGPCGQYRDKLEKNLVPLLDTENMEFIEHLSEVIPLLSYAGGGGNAGEKHITDWNLMLTKFLRTAYSTLYHLYGDSCPSLEMENPFEGDQLAGLKRIAEPKVLLRISLLKRRLQTLLLIISGYLRLPFPAPKLVPQKGILKLIGSLTSVNPVTSLKSTQMFSKESVFLNAVVSGIHVNAMHLLRNLFSCVGSNIFVEGVAVEQIITSEFKWIQERPRSFEKLKLELYETLISWLTMCRGIVTNLKTLGTWINAIGSDSQIEKEVVELKVLSKPKAGKSGLKPSSSPLSLTMTASTSTQTYVEKSAEVTQMSLQTLLYLIPALDPDNHRRIYEHLVKTVSIINQFHTPPFPYDIPQCRYLLYETLSSLALNPQLRSPVSLSLLLTLLRKGLHDPAKVVSSFCSKQISIMERLIHPISAPLGLAGPFPNPIPFSSGIKPGTNADVTEIGDSDDNDEGTTEMDTDEITQPASVQSTAEQNNLTLSARLEGQPMDQNNLQLMIKNAIRDILKESHSQDEVIAKLRDSQTETSTPKSKYDFSAVSNSNNGIEIINDSDSESNEAIVNRIVTNGDSTYYHPADGEDSDKESIEVVNDNSFDEASESPKKRKRIEDRADESSPNKVKVTSADNSPGNGLVSTQASEGPTYEEMISSFVDIEPENTKTSETQ